MKDRIIKKINAKTGGIYKFLLLTCILLVISGVAITLVYFTSNTQDKETLIFGLIFLLIGLIAIISIYLIYKFGGKFRLFNFDITELNKIYDLVINDEYLKKLDALKMFFKEEYKYERSLKKAPKRILYTLLITMSLAVLIAGLIQIDETIYIAGLILSLLFIVPSYKQEIFKAKPKDLQKYLDNNRYQILNSDFNIIVRYYNERKKEKDLKYRLKKQKQKIQNKHGFLFWTLQMFLFMIIIISVYLSILYNDIYYKVVFIGFAIIIFIIIIRNINLRYNKTNKTDKTHNQDSNHETIYNSLYKIKKHEKSIAENLDNQLAVNILYDLLVNNNLYDDTLDSNNLDSNIEITEVDNK